MIITDIKATSNEAHFGKQIRQGSQTKGETKKPNTLFYRGKIITSHKGKVPVITNQVIRIEVNDSPSGFCSKTNCFRVIFAHDLFHFTSNLGEFVTIVEVI